MKLHRSRLKTALLLATMLTPLPGIAIARAEPAAGQTDAQATEATAPVAAADKGDVSEMIVTATRRNQALSKVPISVMAFDQEKMDAQGIKNIDDIARLTPGLNFSQQSYFSGSNTNISIRGVSSTVGTGTTGIYIDDVPIQLRSIGYGSANTYPKIFDLERVEVLRGPQGTLFGAGAEGGAVRFITPQPSLTDYSVYGRSELAFTEGGDPSYEAGVAVGGPILQDKIGFRVSAWGRKDGGWVDRVNYADNSTVESDSNSSGTHAFKGAVSFALTPDLIVTPSIYYQKEKIDDTSGYWESLSRPGDGEFHNGYVQAQPVDDKYVLPSLNITYDFGWSSLISTTSYFDRDANQTRDYTFFDQELLTPGSPYPTIPGQIASGFFGEKQNNFTQEVRLQSDNNASRLKWVVGAFYSHEDQVSTQRNQDYYYEQVLFDTYGLTFADLGSAYLPGGLVYDSRAESKSTQIAGFGQLDLNVTDELTLTAGVRVANLKNKHSQVMDGWWAGGYTTTAGESSETPVTPKFGVSYQYDPNNLLYASASKGFRAGGAQTPVPTSICGADLAAMGYSSSPDTYKSDSTWSYEAGSKNNLFNRRLQVDANVFLIKWKDIQSSVYLPTCSSVFIGNMGSVTSKGVELSLSGRVVDGVTLGLTMGYTDATYDETITGNSGVVLVQEGSAVSNMPKLTLGVSGQYDFAVWDENNGYARFDYTYTAKGQSDDPHVYSYDPELTPAPPTHMLNARAGVTLSSGLDVSLFVDNITDANPGLARYHFFYSSPIYTNRTFRPRTGGITLAYRY